MKRKQRLVSKLSKERIFQLSNDLSEGIESGSVSEWRAVALHFRKQHDKSWNELRMVYGCVSTLIIADGLKKTAVVRLQKWIKEQGL